MRRPRGAALTGRYDLESHWSGRCGNISIDASLLREHGAKALFRSIYFGNRGAHANFRRQFGAIVKQAQAAYHLPVLFTETGAPLNINGNRAFKTGRASGDPGPS